MPPGTSTGGGGCRRNWLAGLTGVPVHVRWNSRATYCDGNGGSKSRSIKNYLDSTFGKGSFSRWKTPILDVLFPPGSPHPKGDELKARVEEDLDQGQVQRWDGVEAIREHEAYCSNMDT